MYKLVAVAGKIRGKEFILEQGENILGRTEGLSVSIPLEGISKNHLSITNTGDSLYLKDLGSANGTFVNGKSVENTTLQDKDKITLPDVILQVVYVREKKIIIQKKSESIEDDSGDFLAPKERPNGLFEKILFLFKYKFMTIIHGINKEYDWKILFGILLSIFILIMVSAITIPIFGGSKELLFNEIARRGIQYADEISRANFRALEQGKLDQVNTAFLNNDDSIESYELFDLEGRIVAPIEKRNEYISDAFSVKVLQKSKKGLRGRGYHFSMLGEGKFGIGKNILAFNNKTGSTESVGIIVFKFFPKSLALESINSSKAYFESLIKAILMAIIFFGIIYYLTIRPLEEIQFQADQAIKGKLRVVEGQLLFSELKPLKDTINSTIQLWRDASQSDDDHEFKEMESDEKYISQLSEFIVGSGVPTIILNSHKELMKINTMAEDITGIRENAASGLSLLDCAPTKGFAGAIIECCEKSESSHGTSESVEFEIQGNNYDIHVVALIGKDDYAKAFYVTFIREGI